MSSLPPNPYIAGAALGGEQGFFGREDILREVERTLHRPQDNAIVLYGQRRIGKTSILLQLQRRLPNPPFVPVYFDLMDKARLPIHQVLYELALSTAMEIGLPSPSQEDFEHDPSAFDQLFLPQLYHTLGDQRQPVFLLDEFDVLDIDSQHDPPESTASQVFFPYLRQLMKNQPRLNFVVVVGRRVADLSINFLSTFKDTQRHSISVLKPEAARALILQAERQSLVRYESAAVEHILALTRGHPYLTQLTCQRVFDYTFSSDKSSKENIPLITLEDVETVIPTVLETGAHAFEWIWKGLPPAERIIFSAIAGQTQPGAVFSEDDLRIVLQEAGIRILVKELKLAPQTLVDWQMLEQVDGGYRFFVEELMRRWVAEHRPLDKVKDELDRISPQADNLYQTAQTYYRQGQNKLAITQLNLALEANPNHLKARLLLGTIQREDGHLMEALAAFEEVHRQDEREGRFELLRTLLQQGETLETNGDEAAALNAYERALALSPHEQTALTRRVALWRRLGDQALAAREYTAAIEAYRQAGAEKEVEQVEAQKRQADIDQLSKEAEAYFATGKWEEAHNIYWRLYEFEPENQHWRQAITKIQEERTLAERYAEGRGHMQQREWEKAQQALGEIISKRPAYRDAAELLVKTKRQNKSQPSQNRLWVITGVIIILLFVTVGAWSYYQVRIQTENIDLTATAVAQTIASADVATQVAIAVQSTQLAQLQATQAAQSTSPLVIEPQDTPPTQPPQQPALSPTPIPNDTPTSPLTGTFLPPAPTNSTPLFTPTITPTPEPIFTPTPPSCFVKITKPEDNLIFKTSEEIQFTWWSTYPLGEDEYYRVSFRNTDGQEINAFETKNLGFKKAAHDTEIVSNVTEHNAYRWTVTVVRRMTPSEEELICAAQEVRGFIWRLSN